MVRRHIAASLALLLSGAGAEAQTPVQTPSQNAAPAAGPVMRVKQLRQQVTVTADGQSVTTTTVQFQLLNGALTAQLSQIPVNYDASLQSAEISDAYTLKANGDKVPVDPNNILTQKVAAASLVPIYSNAEQKIIIFLRVEAGDMLVYTSKITEAKPMLGNQYTLSRYFPVNVEADDSIYSISVPASMHLNVAQGGMKQETSTEAGQTRYSWSLSNLAVKATPSALVFESDALPHFLVSTFKDYDGFAHDFAARIDGKVAASAAVQKQADSITAGITDRRQQARALYDWVNHNVRYVAIELGVGGIIPHDPDWTMSNGFGDCKDQAVLYASLLKAKGIRAELVLINATNRYRLTGVPTISEFNHMIVWLPDLALYADTTVPGTSFGMLPLPDYGKPVLHVVMSGPAQHATPLVPAGFLSSTYKVHAVQNAQGGFDTDVTVAGTGPWANTLRHLGADIQSAGSVTAGAAILKMHNFPNANGTLQSGTGSEAQYSITGTFHNGRPGPQGNMLALANGLYLLPRAGDYLGGPLNNKTLADTDETPCFSGKQVEDISFDFTGGAHLAATPADLHLKTANASYDTHWSTSGATMTLHREFAMQLDQPICTAKTRHDMAALLSQIRDDYATPTHLAAAAPAAGGN